ncbi:MAG: putative selenium-dependent hydroxylase accessory protein YqeC [Chloroflexi bacterium]|nr:putative selenium-dependent hydroxylase accessory protein YqeC [Chloroflexota bacterium]
MLDLDVNLEEALDIRPGEVVSVVGGGGKTTLMFALAGELVLRGKTVVTTTTTKIMKPSDDETPCFLLDRDGDRLLAAIVRELEQHRHMTVASERALTGKVIGIRPELVDRIAQVARPHCIIVEADGAARKPLKAPNSTEPVIPLSTSLVVAVAGIDSLGQPLTRDYVFRAEIISELVGLPLGEAITAEAVARLLTHPQGIAKGAPARARIIPFLNKVDTEDRLAQGKDLAAIILSAAHPQIDRVVLGRVQSPEPVALVVRRSR